MNADLAGCFRHDGRTYLVAGAGGDGIGTATAELLSALGSHVVCVDRDGDAARGAAEATGGDWLAGDITDEQAVVSMVATAVERHGRLDGMVDVVGGSTFTSIPELTLEEWNGQFTSNLQHAFLLGRHVGNHLAANGGGGMVFVGSNAALNGSRTFPAYSTAKLALIGWVRSLAEEFGPSGVRANVVAPGATLTQRMADIWSPGGKADMAKPTMLGRLGTSQEIAGPVAFLLSHAAGNITAQTLVVDGGATLKDPVYGSGTNRGGAEIRARHHPSEPVRASVDNDVVGS